MNWKDEIIEKYRQIQKERAELATYMMICMGLMAGAMIIIRGISDWLMILGCFCMMGVFYHIRKTSWKNYHSSTQSMNR